MIGFFNRDEYNNELKDIVCHDFYLNLNDTIAFRLLGWYKTYGLRTHLDKVNKMAELLKAKPIYWTAHSEKSNLSFEYKTAIWACYLNNSEQPFIIYLSNKGFCIEIPKACGYKEELANELILILCLDKE